MPQPNFGLPPDWLSMLQGGQSNFAPTPAQAQPDRAALEQQAYGYDPEPVKEPNKIADLIAMILGGYADATSAHGAASSAFHCVT